MEEQLNKEKHSTSSMSALGYTSDENVVRLRPRKESDSSCSSSISSSYKRGVRIPPTRASEWKLRNLEDLGISYEEQITPLSEFMSRLKTNKYVVTGSLIELPTLSRKLIDIIESVWTFSFDLSDKELATDDFTAGENVKVVEDALEDFNSKQDEMESELADELKDFHRKRLFYHWQFSVDEFLNFCCILLSRWNKPDEREGKFTNLFMAFGKMFFLTPETGESFREFVIVNNTIIHGIPDIRYVTYNRVAGGTKGQQVLIVTEVKKYDSFRGDPTAESFNFTNLSSKVLGQHGIELLLERQDSFFHPGVVGIICIGTKVIFTYLRVPKEHFDKIQFETAEAKMNYKSYIAYTRPYDFMDVHDRKEILEPLTWFGNLQFGARNFHK